jgi:hypothetical protein
MSRSHAPGREGISNHCEDWILTVSKKRLVVFAIIAALAASGIGAVIAPRPASACVWMVNC